MLYNFMAGQVEYSDEFRAWWDEQSEKVQDAITAKVHMLMQHGPNLQRPHVETLAKMSRHANLKELRVQSGGDAYRVLFAFDPRRIAILLMGGRKPDQGWYKKTVPQADKLYDEHIEELRREGLLW